MCIFLPAKAGNQETNADTGFRRCDRDPSTGWDAIALGRASVTKQRDFSREWLLTSPPVNTLGTQVDHQETARVADLSRLPSLPLVPIAAAGQVHLTNPATAP